MIIILIPGKKLWKTSE